MATIFVFVIKKLGIQVIKYKGKIMPINFI